MSWNMWGTQHDDGTHSADDDFVTVVISSGGSTFETFRALVVPYGSYSAVLTTPLLEGAVHGGGVPGVLR